MTVGATEKRTYGNRLECGALALRSLGVEAALFTPGPDLYYLTGFEHSHAGERLLALVLRSDGSYTWIVPEMNVPQVTEATGLRVADLCRWSDAETFMPALQQAVSGVTTLAFDDEARAGFLLDLLAVAPEIRVRKAGEIARALRVRKDADELAAMRAAARTVDATIPEAISFCRPGRRENEIEEDLKRALLRRSPESSVAFSIIASGENAALPHHETGARVLQAGDVVVLDYGTRLHGYHSDITVTCSVGEPADAEVRKVYRTVWEAQQRALEAVRPGVPCEAIDRAARAQINDAGYGAYFIHRTGHGLGLQVHEAPYMVEGNSEPLEEGMVFSVEPGIYLPGRFGIRLEVIASVAADGVSLINAPSAPELPIAG